MPPSLVVHDPEHVQGTEMLGHFREYLAIRAFGVGQIAALMDCQRLPKPAVDGIGRRVFRGFRHRPFDVLRQQC